MQEVRNQENGQNKQKIKWQVFKKIWACFEKGLVHELGQKKIRESEKKRLIRKQRQAKYANILERKQDQIFSDQQFIKQFRAKMAREKIEQLQREFLNAEQQIRPRNQNSNIQPIKKQSMYDTYDMIAGDFTEIENFLEYQSSKNTLDCVEKKEMQLLQAQDQNSSQSFNQSMNYALNNQLPHQKRIFPFESYQPKYKDCDLNQLEIEQSCNEIDGGISSNGNEIVCFTQYDDQYFGFALSNGLIVVRDIITKKSHEVSYQNHKLGSSSTRSKDITCLQLTPDLRHILASHESGAISMYDFKYQKVIFHMKNIFKYSASELESRSESNLVILDFKVIAQNLQKDEIYLLINNARGDCILAKIFKGFLQYEAQVIPLMKSELFPLTQISILGRQMQSNYFQNDYDKEDDFIIAIQSPEKLFIIRIKLQKMKAKLIFKHVEKQDTLVKKVKNCFSWGEIKFGKEYQLMFIASFSNNFYTGILQKQQEESIKDQGKTKIRNQYSFDLKRRIKHYTSIIFVGQMFRNIFLICDFNNQFYLINSSDLRTSFNKYVNLSFINSQKLKLHDLNIKPSTFKLDSTQVKAQKIVKQSIDNAMSRNSSFKAEDVAPVIKEPEVQSELVTLVNKIQVTFTKSYSFSMNLQKCYILLQKESKQSTSSQFACISLVSWRQTLEELIKQGEYLNSMSFLSSIYQGYHKFAHNGMQKYALNDLLIPQIERISLNYVEKVLKSIKDEQQNTFTLKEEKLVLNSSYSSMSSSQVTTVAQTESFYEVQFLSEHDRMIFCMEFLVECQLSDCIFYEIRPLCHKILGQMDYYIECIEPLILEGKITQVPNDVLADIIDYYQQRGNLRIIQQILTGLDLKHLDTKPLVQVSMEKQLITALIYLSTRSQFPDFITPLMVFWNQFVSSLRVWEQKYKGKSKSFIQSSQLNPEDRMPKDNQIIDQIIKDHDTDVGEFLKEQIILSFVKDLLKIKCEYYGLRALWYFRLCMQQRFIDGEYINDDDYKQLTLSFEAWISFPDNIRVCLQRWPQVFFQVLKTFFSEKPLKIMNTDQSKFKQYSKDIEIDKLKEQTADFCSNRKRMLCSEVLLRQIILITTQMSQQFDVVSRSSMAKNTFSYSEQQDQGPYSSEIDQQYIELEDDADLTSYQLFVERRSSNDFDSRLNLRRQNLVSSFYIFLANLIYQSQCSDKSSYLGGLFSFNTNKVIEIVFYIAQNHKCLNKIEFTADELQKQAKIFSEGRDDKVDFREVAQFLRSEFLLSLIMYILPYIDQQKLQHLSQLLDQTEFSTARSHILLVREHYHRAIDSYIQSPNKIMNRQIFDWMWQNLTQSQYEDQKKYDLLKEIMRMKLPDFIKIDSEKTHQLFQKFLNDAEHDIISQLKNNPNLQLLYIQNVVKQYKLKIKADPSSAENMKVDTKILIMNIQLMCQLNKPEEEVLQEVTSLDFYPFKEILKICLDKQYLEVCSHVYLRMGLQDMALRQQTKMLENTLSNYKKYLEELYLKMQSLTSEQFIRPINMLVSDMIGRHQSFQFDFETFENEEESDSRSIALNFLNRSTSNTQFNTSEYQQQNGNNPNEQIQKFNKQVDQRLQQMFYICQINKHPDSSDNWFLMLDLLIEIGKKIPEMEKSDSLKNLRKTYTQIIGNTILEIANYIDMDDLLDKLRSSYTEINIDDLKETFTKLMKNSIESFQILYNCLVYIEQDLMNLMHSGSDTFLKGTNSSNYCSTCYDPLNSMDNIKRKIRKQVIQRNQQNLSLITSYSNDGQIPLENCNSMIEDEEEDTQQIIMFCCGHSYHKECYYRQKNVRICLECVRAKNQLYFLIVSRNDIDFTKLSQFIKKQQELLFEKYSANRNSSDLSFSRSSSYFETMKTMMDEEQQEIQKFNKLRRMNKLKNFDKMKQQKYTYFEKDSVKKVRQHI